MHYDEKRFENPDVFDVSFLPRLISCELSIPILFDGKYSLRSSEGHRRGREVGVFWVFLLPSGNS
jgi:hypothetical protein